ncbi:hypothetical protein K2Z83_20380 [Oscillochloris sp. ZM17-4]|uniref:hypothetical protein n=1 Tax=Oscillochloris sp. ZM17-4 TaxID=2866714 RepID=UPI001C72F8AD|nr:hypothetical protein [Oscillochloris sp. ZM17-4]MBX0330029.1 hypothetical protein [Oscillochloris sp. ZM17-4]
MTTEFTSIVPRPGDIVPGSVAAMARQNGGKVAPPEIIVLFDHSYSMDAKDARLLDGRTAMRYEAGCEQLALLQRRLPGKIAVLAFSSDVTVCPNGVPPAPTGTTNLYDALQKAKQADSGAVRFVLISDGLPDNANNALELARSFSGQIDAVLIGNHYEAEAQMAEDFMTALAAATGGTFMRDASGMRALADNVIKLLGVSDGTITTV